MPEENEKKDSSAVGKVNSLGGKAKNLERAYKTAKKARLLATALATSEVWVPVVIVGLTIGVLFIVLFGGVSGVNGGNPPSPSPSPTNSPVALCSDQGGFCEIGACAAPDVQGTGSCSGNRRCCITSGSFTCLSGKYAVCLKQSFNIVVTGTTNSTLLSKIFFAFAYASKSSGYRSKLMATGNTLNINAVPDAKCWGVTKGPNEITLHNGTCSFLNQASITYLLIHESGHVIAKRNPRIYQAFPYSPLTKSDTSCWQYSSAPKCGNTGYFLKSYPLRYYCAGWGGCVTDITSKSESFAESIADYLTSTSYWKTGEAGLCAQTINKFSSTCFNTFSWLKTYIYGGYTFY